MRGAERSAPYWWTSFMAGGPATVSSLVLRKTRVTTYNSTERAKQNRVVYSKNLSHLEMTSGTRTLRAQLPRIVLFVGFAVLCFGILGCVGFGGWVLV